MLASLNRWHPFNRNSRVFAAFKQRSSIAASSIRGQPSSKTLNDRMSSPNRGAAYLFKEQTNQTKASTAQTTRSAQVETLEVAAASTQEIPETLVAGQRLIAICETSQTRQLVAECPQGTPVTV